MKDKIAVAHIFYSLRIGGMEKVGIDLIKNLNTEKFENYIVCLDEVGPLGEELIKEGFKVMAFHKGHGYNFKFLPKLVRFLKEKKIKIVNTNNPSPHFWGGLASFIAGIKICIHTKHGVSFVDVPRRKLLNKISALFNKKIVCVSESVAQLTIEKEGIPAEKVCTVHNGIDTNSFIKEPVNQSLSREFKITNSKIIGSIARFVKDKDQGTLIKAFKKLIDKKIDAKLFLVGDGDTKDSLVSLVKILNIEEHVVFTGYRKDVKDFLNLFDIYVLSTHTEGISISLLEAMAVENACVATDVGGNSEIIKNGFNGELVAENDVNGLSSVLNKLIVEENYASKLAVQARKDVLKNFSLKKMTEKYENIYLSEFGKIFKNNFILMNLVYLSF